jgi:hypothetical protein
MMSFIDSPAERYGFGATFRQHCRPEFREFVSVLGKPINPIIQYFPYSIWDLWMKHFNGGANFIDLQQGLRKYSPVIYRLMNYWNHIKTSDPYCANSVLEMMIVLYNRARQLYENSIDNPVESLAVSSSGDDRIILVNSFLVDQQFERLLLGLVMTAPKHAQSMLNTSLNWVVVSFSIGAP